MACRSAARRPEEDAEGDGSLGRAVGELGGREGARAKPFEWLAHDEARARQRVSNAPRVVAEGDGDAGERLGARELGLAEDRNEQACRGRARGGEDDRVMGDAADPYARRVDLERLDRSGEMYRTPGADRGRERVGKRLHPAGERADPRAACGGRDLEAERLGRLARSERAELVTVEAEGGGGRLVEQRQPAPSAIVGDAVAGPRQVSREARHRLAPRHEALGAELHDPSVLACGRELTAKAIRRLVHRDLMAREPQAVAHREARQTTTDDRNPLHGHPW